MALNVGINGFGRIGRIIFRTCFQNPGLKVSAINDPAVDIEYICYLIKFDSTHGKFKGTVERSENEITIDGQKIYIFKEKLPTDIPWQKADVTYVVEASGMFTSLDKASGHLASEGVKRVLVTAPSLDVPMIVVGVNDDKLGAGYKVISCTSSTLYCLAPIVKILEDHFGISEGFITSIHAMTPSLKPLDGLCLKGKHWRDHRSIHQNIIPASTGACRALGKIIPQVKDKMTGLAFRVPIVNVSVLDITIRLKTNTSMEALIRHVENAANFSMQNIIKISKEKAVSSDFIGDTYSCILDLDSSLQLKPDFFKLICWYENELSYACRIIDSIYLLEKQFKLEWKPKMSCVKPTRNSLVEQSECQNKFIYHKACSYECHGNLKSLCTTSQDSGFTSLIPISQKQASTRSFPMRQLSYTNKGSEKKELLKIRNDDDKITKQTLQPKLCSCFHSCDEITTEINTKRYTKTRERLENVKKEFSKMISMTENLLKQSQHSKIEIDLPKVPSNKLLHVTKIKDINVTDSKETKEGNNSYTIIEEEVDDNKSNFTFEEDSTNNQNSDICITSINNSKRHSHEEINENILVPCLILTHENGDSEKNTLHNVNDVNSDSTITLNPNNYILPEKTISNYNGTQVLIPKDCTEQNDVENHIINITPLPKHNPEEILHIEEDKCSQNKSWEQNQEISSPITKQSKSFSTTLVNANKDNVSDTIYTNKCQVEITENQEKQRRKLKLRIEGILKKLATDSNVGSEKLMLISSNSTATTATTATNRDIKCKEDIYDKLDSASGTDSENSFHMKERKSQIIKISDLTNSLEDLDRLDKICRIIEISDELSDQLLSALNNSEYLEHKNKQWSFKDFCEKIKLDEFCNKIYNNTDSSDRTK